MRLALCFAFSCKARATGVLVTTKSIHYFNKYFAHLPTVVKVQVAFAMFADARVLSARRASSREGRKKVAMTAFVSECSK
jgi:hypothetical protein